MGGEEQSCSLSEWIISGGKSLAGIQRGSWVLKNPLKADLRDWYSGRAMLPRRRHALPSPPHFAGPRVHTLNPGSRTGPLEHTMAWQTVAGAAGTGSEGKYCLAVPQMKPGGCCHPIWSVTHPRTACTIAASSTSSWHMGYLCPTGSLTATR